MKLKSAQDIDQDMISDLIKKLCQYPNLDYCILKKKVLLHLGI